MARTSLYQRWIFALYASKLTPAERDSLVAYALHMGRTGVVRINLRTVAEWTERDRRDIARHIAKAARLGLLVRIARPNRGRPAAYRVTVPEGLGPDAAGGFRV